MTKFSITIDPPFKAAPRFDFDRAPHGINWGEVLIAHPTQYDVLYHIDGEPFGYYPADISTVFGDLEEELRLTIARRSHAMSLSGYPVLAVNFDRDKATFRDISGFSLLGGRVVGDPCDAKEVEKAFVEATSTAWGCLFDVLRSLRVPP